MLRAILTYHSIDDSGSVVSTSAAAFERQAASLAAQPVVVTRPEKIVDSMDESGGPAAVALTFDDGFENFYTRAFPSLARHGLSATVSLVAGLCGGRSSWAHQPESFLDRELMSWSKIQELQAAGIDFGAHGIDHQSLPSLPIEQARAQILNSKRLVEDRTGIAVECFAYPYGEMSPPIAEIVAENFAVGLSTDMGFVNDQSQPEALERIDAYYLQQPFWFDRLFQPSGRSYVGGRAAARKWKQRLFRRGEAATQTQTAVAQ